MSFPVPIIRLCLVAALGLAARGTADEPQEGQKHWAFRPLMRPDPPAVADPARARTPVDRFLIARLDAAKLSLAPEADKATLIRRASLDLVGLPPSPDEVTAFVSDPAPDAFERLLDRLMASPQFGERWARHWLDGAGYVDVTGGDNDAAILKLGENKWLYRDYVIRSFNADKPFDRFLTEQLAGDEVVNWREAKAFTPEIREALIATGFLRTAADDTDENELNTLDIRHGVLQRTAEVLANNLLGLTLNCAKCHDHKYEPLSQKDYYGFMALLQPAFNPDHWLQPKQRLLAALPPAEKKAADEHNAVIDKEIAEANKHKLEPDAQKKKLAELNAKRRTYEHWQVVYDVGPPTPTRLLRRGDHTAPGAEVAPGFPSVLCSSPPPRFGEGAGGRGSGLCPPASGRRLTLARWLTDDTSRAGALVLRVRVNRVWRHLFGRGLVEPADNFGLTGAKPTHPELLDWLATEFAGNGGRLKPLLRVLMTSAAYRQGSVRSEESGVRSGDLTPHSSLLTPHSKDPDNRLLGRMPLRRLESEVIRDSILAVSGKLDHSLGGPPVPVDVKPDGSLAPKDGDRPRRSVYLLARRNYHPTLLGVFDQPVLTTNCTGRQSSAVVLQSLAMLNDEFVRNQAERIAERAGGETDAAFRLVLGRGPTATEAKVAADLLAAHRARGKSPRQALAHLCHVLLNTSEFLYAP